MALAESYMKKAGYSSGKYTGNCTITMVGDNTPPGSNTSQLVKQQLTQLGFNVQLHPVEHADDVHEVLSVVANEPNVCPTSGWAKDFNDGQAMIDSRSTAARSPVPDEQLELASAERPGDQLRARRRRG